jgi:thiamine-phosphate pyrophosphorylase
VIAPRLIAITPGRARRAGELEPLVVALGGAGLPALLVREPELDPAELAALLAVASRHVPVIVVHERVRGAHAGRLPIHQRATATEVPAGVFSRSCHDGGQVDAALATGAWFVVLSPVWRPTSKPGDRRSPLGPDRFLAIGAGRPVLALGGVTPARYRELRRRGAHGAAISGDLFDRGPADAAARLRQYGKIDGS